MEQFEQLLTCAICLDRYRNPKLLPCQHSFCMEPCMDGLVDYVRRQVKCPECRAEHRIPYQGVQAFPTNVTLQRFLELHIEITGELPDPTSGQTMERCGVCSEKSYCALCVHCEKKCCPECKDAHMDILRREITRINSQIRRGLHKLQDALALVEKNTLGLQTNCASVLEEVDEIYRRLSKALKDRTEHLRNEVDRYLGTELRGLIQLKENLELEIANIQSNCDLAEAHINENVPWDDSELLDTKELFLRTVEFIRNFEYEAGDYNRRVRFVMAHDPNQLVLHVAGYGELNIKPETGTGGLLGSSSSLAPPVGSPGLMRSKSDHRLASQYRQQEEERLARNRYVPEYEYDAPEYEAPRNKSRYRSRFMRHRDGDDSDGDTRSTVRFTSTPQDSSGLRERVLDTEDAARGPLSGIFRLTDSPRVMKKLQECEKATKRKKEEPTQQPAQQPQQPKPQVQVRKVQTAVARHTSDDDEISRIKKQNKSATTPTETVEERQPAAPASMHPQQRETPQEREPEEPARRPAVARRTSTDTHTPAARSASSDSSTGSESSTGSGIRSTGAPFTTEEMKQKYLSRAPPANTTTTGSPGPTVPSSPTKESANASPTSRPFQSRFLATGNRAAPPPPAQQPTSRDDPAIKKKAEEEDEDEETSSSSEETESETEEESETDAHPSSATPSGSTSAPQDRQRSESAMARTDIGPLLARSAEARRGSKEDSPSTRYSSPRGSPAQSVSRDSVTGTGTATTGTSAGIGSAPLTTPLTTSGGYTSRTFTDANDEPSTVNRTEDCEINAASSAAYDSDGAHALRVKPHSSNRTRTDGSTDTDETHTSSSSSSVTSPANLDGTRSYHGHSRVENRSVANGAAIVDGRSGNELNSFPPSRSSSERASTLTDDSLLQPNRFDSEPPADSPTASRTDHSREDSSARDSRTEGSRESTSSNANLTSASESESESESESGTETDAESGSESEEEEDYSRDENSNIKTKKTDRDDANPGNPADGENPMENEKTDSGSGQVSADSESEDDNDDDDDDDDETTVLSVRSNPHSETNLASLERYDDSTKRRSSSIIGEKSIEELFDDNGWVITDQDLQAENPQRIARSVKPVEDRENTGDGSASVGGQSGGQMQNGIAESVNGPQPAGEDSETSNTESGHSLSGSRSTDSLPRNRDRQGSIGKNGWLVSDESESESEWAVASAKEIAGERERTAAGTEDTGRTIRLENTETMTSGKGSAGERAKRESEGPSSVAGEVGEAGREPSKDSTVVADKAWSIDENGWVILNKVDGVPVARDPEARGMLDEASTIRSQTTDLVLKTNIENGAVVANATQSKESKSSNEHGDTAGVDISIPMQMVTTVFCVSVLCYSVLINLFL